MCGASYTCLPKRGVGSLLNSSMKERPYLWLVVTQLASATLHNICRLPLHEVEDVPGAQWPDLPR